MPQVPVYSKSNTPLVTPDSSPLRSQQISVNPEMFGAGVAKAQVAQGSAIETAGEQMFKRALEVQELKNQTDARDASNKFITEMGEADLQYRQLEGKAAIDGYQSHVENIKKIHEKYAGGMGNDSAKRYFLNDSSRQLTYNIINSSHWAATQGKKYRSSVNEASVKIARNNVAAQPDDLSFSNNLASINEAVESESINSHWSPQEKQVKKDQQISGAWSDRLGVIALTDPVRAKTLFDKNKSQIKDADALYKIERTIHQSMMTKATDQLANEVVDGVSTPSTVQGREAKMLQHYTRKYGAAAAAGIVGNAYVESAGTYDPSIPGDSGKSIGVFQHYAERKAELEKWAGEHGRNPRDLQTQMEFADYELENNPRFAGVAQAIRSAKTPEEAAKIWHDKFEVPQPGSLGMRQARARELAGKKYEPIGLTPNTTPGQLNEMLQVAEQRANAVMPGNEDFIEATKSRVRTKYEAVKKVANDIKSVYYQSFMSSLINDKITTMDQLFKGDPNRQEAYWQLTPEQHRSIQSAMEKNAGGRETKWTPARAARSNELAGMADTDPERFKKLVLANEDIPMHGDGGILGLQKKQRELSAPVETADAAAKMTETAFIHVRTMVAPLGITNAPKVGADDENTKKSNMFVGAFNRDVEAFYKKEGRAPNATESREIASNLIRVQQESSWRNWTNEERLFEVTVPDTYSASLKALNPGSDLSEEEIRYQYISQLRANRGKKWNPKTATWQN